MLDFEVFWHHHQIYRKWAEWWNFDLKYDRLKLGEGEEAYNSMYHTKSQQIQSSHWVLPSLEVYPLFGIVFTNCQETCEILYYVTLHHKMSINVPDGHFHVFIFSEGKFYAFYNGENRFQIRGLVAELFAFEYGGTAFSTFEKTCFKCWRLLL